MIMTAMLLYNLLSISNTIPEIACPHVACTFVGSMRSVMFPSGSKALRKSGPTP